MASSVLPATWPVSITPPKLTGNLVQLEKLDASHLHELAAAGTDLRVWEFTTSSGENVESMQAYIDGLLRDWQQGSAVPFVVRTLEDQRIVGCTRLKELDRRHRHAIVGSWYAPMAWRTGANLDAKLLLLDYAFETLGCIRIEFHTDVRNRRSRDSLEKLGATLEGVLRAHQITRDGRLRDSAIYSILQSEWPSLRTPIAERLKRGSHSRGK